ncbi:MAG: hypothetical protein JSS31_03650 [Proteobacteria bacterium]|nr:hypothetical protein [Pseudomonadota bacterium]MBS0493045.1 hypothetical protein [Pseudomonadota bacterium]
MHPPQTHTPLQPLRHRLALAWLLLALVLAPLLGRMHQVLHVPVSGPALPHLQHGAAPVSTVAQQALDALHALFAGHGNADCQVLDHQTLVGAAAGQAPVLGQAAPQLPPAARPAATIGAREAVPFQARAPPLNA